MFDPNISTMKKYFLLILLPAVIFSCDVKRKDKLSDDSKTDSLSIVKQQKDDSAKLAEEKVKQEEEEGIRGNKHEERKIKGDH